MRRQAEATLRPVFPICTQSKALKGTRPWTDLTVSDFFFGFYCFDRGNCNWTISESFHYENELNITYSMVESVMSGEGGG